MKKCILNQEIFRGDLMLGTSGSQEEGNPTCYVAPLLKKNGIEDRYLALEDVLPRLHFSDADCVRFNDDRYRDVLWNELLLVAVEKGKISTAGCEGKYQLKNDKRGLANLYLFWDYALGILRKGGINRFFSNFMAASRFTRWVRAFFVFSMPPKMNKMVSDGLNKGSDGPIMLNPMQIDEPYVEACATANVPSLGRMFVRKLHEYDENGIFGVEGDDFPQPE